MNDCVSNYIHQYPPALQAQLFAIKADIEAAAPMLTRKIAWGMPAYYCGKTDVIEFSAHRFWVSLHIGIETMEHFRQELTEYTTTKSTVHLPFEREIPHALIARIVAHNLALAQGE